MQQAREDHPVTDIHGHLYPPDFLKRLADRNFGPMRIVDLGRDFRVIVHGRPYVTISPGFYDDDLRVDRLDAASVDTQLLTLAPPMVYWARPQLALELCRMVNNHFASIAEKHSGRFVPGAVVPLQAPEQAVRELRRAVLELGHKAVLVGTNVGGMQLDNPRLEPFFRAAESLDVPLFIHPINPLGAQCMYSFRLDVAIGFLTDTTSAAARLILSGVLDRYPRLRICWAHMGGSLLWLADRIEMGRNATPGAQDVASGRVEDYLQRFWYDTAVPAHRNLKFGVETVGSERLLFGSDSPFFGDMSGRIREMLLTAPFLSDEQRTDILSRNAHGFLQAQP